MDVASKSPTSCGDTTPSSLSSDSGVSGLLADNSGHLLHHLNARNSEALIPDGVHSITIGSNVFHVIVREKGRTKLLSLDELHAKLLAKAKIKQITDFCMRDEISRLALTQDEVVQLRECGVLKGKGRAKKHAVWIEEVHRIVNMVSRRVGIDICDISYSEWKQLDPKLPGHKPISFTKHCTSAHGKDVIEVEIIGGTTRSGSKSKFSVSSKALPSTMIKSSSSSPVTTPEQGIPIETKLTDKERQLDTTSNPQPINVNKVTCSPVLEAKSGNILSRRNDSLATEDPGQYFGSDLSVPLGGEDSEKIKSRSSNAGSPCHVGSNSNAQMDLSADSMQPSILGEKIASPLDITPNVSPAAVVSKTDIADTKEMSANQEQAQEKTIQSIAQISSIPKDSIHQDFVSSSNTCSKTAFLRAEQSSEKADNDLAGPNQLCSLVLRDKHQLSNLSLPSQSVPSVEVDLQSVDGGKSDDSRPCISTTLMEGASADSEPVANFTESPAKESSHGNVDAIFNNADTTKGGVRLEEEAMSTDTHNNLIPDSPAENPNLHSPRSYSGMQCQDLGSAISHSDPPGETDQICNKDVDLDGSKNYASASIPTSIGSNNITLDSKRPGTSQTVDIANSRKKQRRSHFMPTSSYLLQGTSPAVEPKSEKSENEMKSDKSENVSKSDKSENGTKSDKTEKVEQESSKSSAKPKYKNSLAGPTYKDVFGLVPKDAHPSVNMDKIVQATKGKTATPVEAKSPIKKVNSRMKINGLLMLTDAYDEEFSDESLSDTAQLERKETDANRVAASPEVASKVQGTSLSSERLCTATSTHEKTNPKENSAKSDTASSLEWTIESGTSTPSCPAVSARAFKYRGKQLHAFNRDIGELISVAEFHQKLNEIILTHSKSISYDDMVKVLDKKYLLSGADLTPPEIVFLENNDSHPVGLKQNRAMISLTGLDYAFAVTARKATSLKAGSKDKDTARKKKKKRRKKSSSSDTDSDSSKSSSSQDCRPSTKDPESGEMCVTGKGARQNELSSNESKNLCLVESQSVVDSEKDCDESTKTHFLGPSFSEPVSIQSKNLGDGTNFSGFCGEDFSNMEFSNAGEISLESVQSLAADDTMDVDLAKDCGLEISCVQGSSLNSESMDVTGTSLQISNTMSTSAENFGCDPNMFYPNIVGMSNQDMQTVVSLPGRGNILDQNIVSYAPTVDYSCMPSTSGSQNAGANLDPATCRCARTTLPGFEMLDKWKYRQKQWNKLKFRMKRCRRNIIPGTGLKRSRSTRYFVIGGVGGTLSVQVKRFRWRQLSKKRAEAIANEKKKADDLQPLLPQITIMDVQSLQPELPAQSQIPLQQQMAVQQQISMQQQMSMQQQVSLQQQMSVYPQAYPPEMAMSYGNLNNSLYQQQQVIYNPGVSPEGVPYMVLSEPMYFMQNVVCEDPNTVPVNQEIDVGHDNPVETPSTVKVSKVKKKRGRPRNT